MAHQANQHLNHDQFGYLVVNDESNRILGGIGGNYYRPWVFPLYTPSGLTVLQEFPYDHPFHNGYFVGQGPILVGDEQREVKFWASPPMRKPNEVIFENLGRMDCLGAPEIESIDEESKQGVRFTIRLTWRDQNESPVLDEVRTVAMYEERLSGATVCDMSSQKIAAYGPLTYTETKFGNIGVRIEPRLIPQFGGEVIAGVRGQPTRRGEADVALDQDCDFVAFETTLAATGERYGILSTVLDDTVLDNTGPDNKGQIQGPWFVRDYGLAFYNATRNKAIATAAGESWTVAFRAIAYDGALTDERAHGWLRL